MKIILISDLHGQPKTLEYLEEIRLKEAPDALILSGDLTNRGDAKFTNNLLQTLAKFKHAFLVCGNADQGQAQNLLENSSYSINQKCKKFSGLEVCGISFGEERNDLGERVGGAIFVTHQPPLKALMNKKYSNSPKFHISGHLHEVAFVKKYEVTTHIQVPTLQEARYAVFDPESGKVSFKKLTQ